MTPNFQEKAREILKEVGMLDNSLDCIKDTKLIAHALRSSYLSGLRRGAEGIKLRTANGYMEHSNESGHNDFIDIGHHGVVEIFCFECKEEILAEVEKVEKEK